MAGDMLLASEVEAGQYMCVRTGGPFGYVIRSVTRSPVNHAFVVLGGGQIAEATLRGVKVDALTKYAGCLAVASSDAQAPVQQVKVVNTARMAAGKEYAWRDIFIIGLRHFGAKWRWLLRAADERDALICSELVCEAGLAAHPAMDWLCGEPEPAMVTPADLASRPGVVPVAWD